MIFQKYSLKKTWKFSVNFWSFLGQYMTINDKYG